MALLVALLHSSSSSCRCCRFAAGAAVGKRARKRPPSGKRSLSPLSYRNCKLLATGIVSSQLPGAPAEVGLQGELPLATSSTTSHELDSAGLHQITILQPGETAT